ncbi:MAG: amidohydrolase family protein, partial [bacterium]
MDYFKDLIAAARGDIFPDLVIRNVKVVNVFTCEIVETEVAIYGDRIAGLDSGYEGRNVLDAKGSFLVPGFIESHFHIESAMLRPSELARLIVPRGTTCLVADPHEIANVSGIEGIEFLLSDSEDLPFDLFVMAPSCVPA